MRNTSAYLNRTPISSCASVVQQGKQLYDLRGSIIANFDPTQKYMYRPDGSVYGYVSGTGKKYLHAPSGEIIGYLSQDS
jgi:hypothetical protein